MFSFLKSVFSEDGTGSYSRLFSGVIVMFTCGWITHTVIHTHAIPDLNGPALFIGSGVGVHYGVNKANDFINSFKGSEPINPNQPQPTNTPPSQ